MRRFFLLLVLPFFCSPLLAGTNLVMDSAQKRIAQFHAGEKPNGAFVRIVYFHAADREPLPDFAARLDRVMTDISEFYREGMEQRFGVKTGGIPLERKDGKLIIHVVRGQHASAHYNYESGNETWAEVQEALTGTLDVKREHVLILYGLCERESDGRFVFNAPYYGAGWSDQSHGLCHAADCDLLDPALLTQKDKPFVFTEHYYPRVESTVAKFNSWYIGGTAHELGHGLGFPHDNGAPGEAPGVALMGGGNLHYREELWGGRSPAYLSLATALRFAAHPIVTHSDKARWQPADAVVEDLTASVEKGKLRLTGKVRASVPPCAIIASAWPSSAKSDHGAMTFCAAVDDDGKFSVELTHLNAPSWNMTLGSLLVNGAESSERFTFECNARGEPETDFLSVRAVDLAEQALMRDPAQAKKFLTDEAILASKDGEIRRRLRLLDAMRKPDPEPIDLTSATSGRAYLSDARWTQAEVGWGKVTRNRYSFSRERWEGLFLKMDGEVFGKGLYAHADSVFAFPIGGNWKTFSAVIGLREGALDQGSAVFTVVGDGKEIYRSKVLRPGKREVLRLDISGVRQLELRVKGGEGHPHNCWAIWADPLVER
ncbi:MAG: NPCBM/NEW2 domain-containing protein [Verrucomicrobiota bacterium]